MRIPLLVLAVLVAGAAALPVAAASHVGPCTHEYVDAVFGAHDTYRRTGSFGATLGYVGGKVGGCVDGAVDHATHACDLTTFCHVLEEVCLHLVGPSLCPDLGRP